MAVSRLSSGCIFQVSLLYVRILYFFDKCIMAGVFYCAINEIIIDFL